MFGFKKKEKNENVVKFKIESSGKPGIFEVRKKEFEFKNGQLVRIR